MRIHHTFGVARGAAGVTHAGCLILISNVPLHRLGLLQQRFILMNLHTRNTCGNVSLAVVHEHQVFHGGERRHQRLENRPQRRVTEDHFVFCVIDDVRELLRKQTEVQGVKHTAGAWCREIQLQVSSRVPRQCGNATMFGDLQVVEHSTQQPCAIGPLAVRRAYLAVGRSGDDSLASAVTLGTFKQMHERELRWLH